MTPAYAWSIGVAARAHESWSLTAVSGWSCCSPTLTCSLSFALTKDLVTDARDRYGGVDADPVLRKVFFRIPAQLRLDA